MSHRVRKYFSASEYKDGLTSGNRLILSKAITLIESEKPEDQALSRELIDWAENLKKPSLRIGISGIPGVGKSTFIEVFANMAIEMGKKVAVLTIDPSSSRSKGSILGDKTRMLTLSNNANAFIRPSPTGNQSSGVTLKTRESIRLCESAGYDIVIVETVGVGQAETKVRDMVDLFILLMIAGAGDELQGIKRGIMELADIIAVNKADGENRANATKTQGELSNAMKYFPSVLDGWQIPVHTCSSIENQGITEIWSDVQEFESLAHNTEYFTEQRSTQNISWMNEIIERKLKDQFYSSGDSMKKYKELADLVKYGKLSVRSAVDRLF